MSSEKKERYMKELIQDLESENSVIKSCESLDEYLKILDDRVVEKSREIFDGILRCSDNEFDITLNEIRSSDIKMKIFPTTVWTYRTELEMLRQKKNEYMRIKHLYKNIEELIDDTEKMMESINELSVGKFTQVWECFYDDITRKDGYNIVRKSQYDNFLDWYRKEIKGEYYEE